MSMNFRSTSDLCLNIKNFRSINPYQSPSADFRPGPYLRFPACSHGVTVSFFKHSRCAKRRLPRQGHGANNSPGMRQIRHACASQAGPGGLDGWVPSTTRVKNFECKPKEALFGDPGPCSIDHH